MGIRVVTDRLQELYRLRARVDLEIRQEEHRARVYAGAVITPVKLSANTRVAAVTVRRWAQANGIPVGKRGRIGEDVYAAYFKAHR